MITTGSVQAPETLYWGLAATLAKHGYVVLTYDVQGQGRSDTFGEGPDQAGGRARAGRPALLRRHRGRAQLLASRTPSNPYEPRKSCGNANNGVGTEPRGQAGPAREARASTPPTTRSGRRSTARGWGSPATRWAPRAVSYIGQIDPRVDAIVAWDNLERPEQPSGLPVGLLAAARRPADHEAGAWACRPTTASFPQPYTSDPDPQAKNQGFLAYKQAGVDSMEAIIRGGTHYEFSFLPGNTAAYPFGTATLRGMDMVAWYSTAWFDRYVKCQGDRELQAERRPPPAHRPLARRLRGGRGRPQRRPEHVLVLLPLPVRLPRSRATASVTCDDMRAGCPTMAPDGQPPNYDYFKDATTPDGR